MANRASSPNYRHSRRASHSCTAQSELFVAGRAPNARDQIKRQLDGQIRKSSFLALLPLVAATIQRGIRPRPVQVLSEFLGSRYLIATLPFPFRRLPSTSSSDSPCSLAMSESFWRKAAR